MSTSDMSPEVERRRAAQKHAHMLGEIEQWQAEHARALETLQQAEAFVREHDALLDHHKEMIAEHARRLEEQAADPASADSSEVQAQLDETEQIHQRVIEQHNRFRGRHPALIREIAQLAVELHKVSHQPG